MKVAIVGGSPSEKLAPFDDESWDIWVHGNQMDRHTNRRVSKVFEIHDDLSEHDPYYPQWLTDFNLPMVVGPHFPFHGDHIEVFNRHEANLMLGGNLLSSTPAYMMVQAINEGATHVGLYGIDMAVGDHEYFKQRPAMYYLIGLARGKGIEVIIPEESALLSDTYDEGRDWGTEKEIEVFNEDEFANMASIHQEKVDEYIIEANKLFDAKTKFDELVKLAQTHDGCRQAYERLSRINRTQKAGIPVEKLTDSLEIKGA